MQAETPIVTEQDLRRLRQLLAELRPGEDGQAEQLDELSRRLEEARVVPLDEVPRSLVTMNSLVGLRDLAVNQKMTCRLVYPDQADPVKHQTPVTGPLGSEILGSSVGHVFECPVPSGTRRLRVEMVYYQPEAAKDFHL
jgi:regulator of nucleoside diphosphate kinase